ncbi:MAG: hypothetical protein ACR2RF_25480 [Geminicoccaceae bacterium]
MANLRTVDDLKEDVLFRAGEPTDGTSDFDSRTIVHLNRAYRILWNGGQEFDPEVNEKWLWLLATSPGVLLLNPALATGTVDVINGNTTVTATGNLATTILGRYFKSDDHADVFRIIFSPGGTVFDLDSVYTGITASSVSYKIFQLNYSLATDVLHLIGPMRVYQEGREEIHGMDESSLDREWPLREIKRGVPRNFAMIGEREVRFSHYGGATSGALIRADYSYLRTAADLASGSTEPLVPFQYRSVLSDMALFYVLKEKQDSEAEAMGLQARQGLRAMAIDNRYRLTLFSRELGRIYPRPDREFRDGPLRTEGGVIIG